MRCRCSSLQPCETRSERVVRQEIQSFACLLVNAEASLNQRLPCNGRAPHICHCEANLDLWRVLLITQLQKHFFSSPTIEGLTVRCAHQEFRSKLWIGVSRANQGAQTWVIAPPSVNKQTRPNVSEPQSEKSCASRKNPSAV